MTSEEVWALVVKNERVLKRELRRFLPRSRWDELDEMYSECVLLRAHAIMRTFDPSRGVQPVTHLAANSRWYAFKWASGKHYKKRPEPTDIDNVPHASYVGTHEESTEVRSILSKLPDDAAQILEWCVLKGYTFREVAAHLEVSVDAVREQYHEAITLARYNGVYAFVEQHVTLRGHDNAECDRTTVS